jgi:hypothetical protein
MIQTTSEADQKFIEEFKIAFAANRDKRFFRLYFLVEDHPLAVEPLKLWAAEKGFAHQAQHRPGDHKAVFSVTMDKTGFIGQRIERK